MKNFDFKTEYKKAPQAIKDLINSYGDDQDYNALHKMRIEFKALGYDLDYGLDGGITYFGKLEDTEYSLLEAVADITMMAKSQDFYSGNSRQDVELIIMWAKEFEAKYKNEVWGLKIDYMDTIEAFAIEKMKEFNK